MGYILFLWVLIKLSVPAWCYVILGISAVAKCVKVGMDLGKE